MLKKLSSNILIYGGTNALKSLIPFIMLPILTTYLSAKDFGILSIIEITILFLTPFILLNINSAINIEYFKVSKRILKYFISNALLLSLIAFIFVSILFIVFQNYLSSIFKIDVDLILILPLFALLRVVSSVLLTIYQATDNPIRYATFTISQTLIDFFFSYLFIVYFLYGFEGRLFGIYFAFLLSSLYGLYMLHKLDYLGKINFRFTKPILSFGLPLIPHVVGGTIMGMSDRYFISYYMGNEDVGLYTVAYQLSALMLLVGQSINQA